MPDLKSSTTSRGALRLQAYRRRLTETDLVRAEILLPQSVVATIKDIAKDEGTKYLETVSALVQMGLEVYRSLALTENPSALVSTANIAVAPAALLGSSAAGPAHMDPASFAANAAAPMFASGLPHGSGVIRSLTSTGSASGGGSTSPLSRFLKARKEAPREQ